MQPFQSKSFGVKNKPIFKAPSKPNPIKTDAIKKASGKKLLDLQATKAAKKASIKSKLLELLEEVDADEEEEEKYELEDLNQIGDEDALEQLDFDQLYYGY